MPATTVEVDRELVLALLGLMPRWGRLAARIARERGGVGPVSWKVLHQLAAGPLRSGELAQVCVLSRPAITELVEGLVGEGLVRRDEDPSDRRAVVVAMTAHGRRELERFESLFTAALGEVLGRIEPARRERLRAALADLHRAFAERDEPEDLSHVR